MRKSVALLVVLLFLLFTITMIEKFFDIYHKSLDSDSLVPAQNSILLRETLSFLASLSKEFNSSEELSQLFITAPISSKDSTFQATFTISPLSNRVNINLLNTISAVEIYLRNICNHYEVRDPDFLISLFQDTIDKDTLARLQESEIAIQDYRFQNGAIYNWTHFETILHYYRQTTQDPSVLLIPWQKYIYFGPTQKSIPLFCDFLEKETAQFLGLHTGEFLDCETLQNDPDNKSIMQKLDIIPFAKSKPFWIIIDINYTLGDQETSLRIIYDINKNKELGIESYPTY